MTTFTNGASRAAGASRATSARPSRAGSTARDIVKRRDKPYKTEQQRIVAKKRKLDLHTSYTKAPLGYTFIQVGTPDLAERCKEMSRQKGFSVTVVNAKPVSRAAHDPDKISHHIHRIGYHFKSEVVEEACEHLGYIPLQGRYVKAADLQKQRQQLNLAPTLLRYGVDPRKIGSQNQRETLDQVRSHLKELFPKIPEQDLNEIVHHAWAEGTKRVGNSGNLELPRRVQLATIARIRHTYTDYDRLLRAFEWKEARSMVEPECLRKLIEWRGEVNEEDDNELEEIVRETIVIDSDDDGAGNASEADDEDSVTELEHGPSDVEITHHVAGDDDLLAESGVDEGARRVLDRILPRQRDMGQRTTIAKQKIGAVRQQLRTTGHVPPVQAPVSYSNGYGTANRPAQEVFIEGKRYQLMPVEATPAVTAHQQLQRPASGAYGQFPVANAAAHSPAHPLFNRSDGHVLRDQAVASIERDDVPATPDRMEKRRRIDQMPTGPSTARDEYRPVYAGHHVSPRYGRVIQVVPEGAEVVDLTSPRRPARGDHHHDERFVNVERPPGSGLHDRPPPGYAPQVRHEYQTAAPTQYGYPPPPPPPQFAPMGLQGALEPTETARYHGDRQLEHGQLPIYQPYAQAPLLQHPIHGAPAPVQQVPRYEPLRQQYVLADGAVAPTQYYYPR